MKPLVIIGGGGHARVLIDALLLQGTAIAGVCDPALPNDQPGPFCLALIAEAALPEGYPPGAVDLVNGIGSIQSTARRREVFERFGTRGYRFANVVHPAAVIARDVNLGEGCQVMASATVQTGTALGRNCIVNTGARVDHDCIIGDHVHLCPGVTLSGGITIGEGSHVGVAATVIQSVQVGRNCLIGAGAVVIRDVAENSTLITPNARTIEGVRG